MKRLFFWIVWMPLAIVLVIFSVANRGAVGLDLWPLPYQVDVPVYLVILGTLIVGFVLGGLYAAIGGAARRARRDHDKRVQAAAKAQSREGSHAHTPVTPPAAPALPAASPDAVVPLPGKGAGG